MTAILTDEALDLLVPEPEGISVDEIAEETLFLVEHLRWGVLGNLDHLLSNNEVDAFDVLAAAPAIAEKFTQAERYFGG